jgi:hypothetical protein
MTNNFTNLTNSWITNLDKNYKEYNDLSQWIDPTITVEHDHILVTGKVVGTLDTYSVLVKIYEPNVCKFRCDCPSIRKTKYCCKHCAALCSVYQESRNHFKVINMYDTNNLLENKNTLELVDLILNFLIEDPMDQHSILEKLRDIGPNLVNSQKKSPKQKLKEGMNTQEFFDSTPLNSQSNSFNSQTSPSTSVPSPFEDVKSPVKFERGNPNFLKYLENNTKSEMPKLELPKLEPIESPMKVEKQSKTKKSNPVVENLKKEISKEEDDVIILE